MFILTADNMKKAENDANAGGMSFAAMMESAGEGCAKIIRRNDKTKKVVILSGKGKNGGDGFVIASKLRQFGFKNVSVILVHGEVTDPLCFQMFASMKKHPVDVIDYTKAPDTALYHISKAEILTDAVFGIGFKGELSGAAADVITAANCNKTAKKYAIDIPSGLSADGKCSGQLYFHSDETLSMISFKPVHVMMPTAGFCGRTTVIDIGINSSVIKKHSENYTALTPCEASELIKKRKFDDNKGSYGKLLTISGSRNMTGCVYFLNKAAAEIGAGLVTAAFPDCIYDVVVPKLNEPVFLPLISTSDGFIDGASRQLHEKIKASSCIAIGCGIGVNTHTERLVEFVLNEADCPVVLDADGINCVTANINILKEANEDIVLTPHPGEMARLTGRSIAEIQSDRIKAASEFASEYGVTLVLKGANTVIAGKDGRVCINTTGNPGMARGGSGDVLTGIIAGLIPQTKDVFDAACAGVYIHGASADITAEKYGILSPTPTRTIDNIHSFLSQFILKE